MILKTAVQQQWNIIFPGSGPGYTVLSKPVDVDNEKWYTIHVSRDIAAWIRTQPLDHWYQHTYEELSRYSLHGTRQEKFDVHGELFVLLKLTWGN
jgi:hypothetical protein